MSFYLWLEGLSDIVGLGYPEIISKLFFEKFGNLANLMAKWYKNYICGKECENKDWFRFHHRKFFTNKSLDIWDLVYLYEHSSSVEEFKKALEFVGRDFGEEIDLEKDKEWVLNKLKHDFFNETFFTYPTLITDILNGTLKNYNDYKKYDFWTAQEKYDKKVIFRDQTPIIQYPNGYKWINVGKKCHLVGKLMKNCGSSGVMSWDEDRTLIVLFDKSNKPHVITTYSPNEKRLSGDQGIASTEVKEKYHDYIMNLADHLGVQFDFVKTKSKSLKIKYLLRKCSNLNKLPISDDYNTYYNFICNGTRYLTDGYMVVDISDLEKLNIKDSARDLFNYLNYSKYKSLGLTYTSIENFAKN